MNTSYVPKGPEKGAGGFMEQACTIVLAFFLYSFTGWLCESIYCSLPAGRFINRGFLTGPLCPVYGFGALLIVFLLSPLQPQPVLLFLAGAVVTSLLEYVTGFLLEKIFHTKLWDYSQRRFNLHGRVCLKNSLLFGAMGLVTVYLLHPFVLDLIGRLPLILLVGLAGGALAAFLLDLIFSVRTMLQLNGKLAELERVAADLRQKGQLTHERLKSEVQERSRQYPSRPSAAAYGWLLGYSFYSAVCWMRSRPCARCAIMIRLSACGNTWLKNARSLKG